MGYYSTVAYHPQEASYATVLEDAVCDSVGGCCAHDAWGMLCDDAPWLRICSAKYAHLEALTSSRHPCPYLELALPNMVGGTKKLING